jgi:hypothetical protein
MGKIPTTIWNSRERGKNLLEEKYGFSINTKTTEEDTGSVIGVGNIADLLYKVMNIQATGR